MKPKILFWLGKNFLIYGMINKLQEQLDFEKYTIIDTPVNINDFFDEQELIKFSKKWNYDELVDIKKENFDIEYLKDFENRYGINLWNLVYTDRLFYQKYNKYYQFSHNQIISLLEQECKLYEKILEESKPDIFLINIIVSHNALLLYHMCKKKNIPVLTLEPTHFKNRLEVKDEINLKIDSKEYNSIKETKNRNKEELLEFLKDYKPHVYQKENSVSKVEKISAAAKFLVNRKDEVEKHYANYGKSKSNILTRGTATRHKIRKKKNEEFLEKNAIKEITDSEKFVYFPLTYEPERQILLGAPFHSNQIAIIENIAKSVPIDHFLYVKEHPGMATAGWRDPDYYQQILELPNVKLIHPSITNEEMIEKTSLVITVRGTPALEAAFYGKPSITFSQNSGYSELPSVKTVSKMEELPEIISEWINIKVNYEDVNRYVNYIENTSFVFHDLDFISTLSKKFNYDVGYLNKSKIAPLEVKNLLMKHDGMFKNLTEKYLIKINSILNKKNVHKE